MSRTVRYVQSPTLQSMLDEMMDLWESKGSPSEVSWYSRFDYSPYMEWFGLKYKDEPWGQNQRPESIATDFGTVQIRTAHPVWVPSECIGIVWEVWPGSEMI